MAEGIHLAKRALATGLVIGVAAWSADTATCPGNIDGGSGGEGGAWIYCDEKPESEDNLINNPRTLEQKIMYGGFALSLVAGIGGALSRFRLREKSDQVDDLVYEGLDGPRAIDRSAEGREASRELFKRAKDQNEFKGSIAEGLSQVTSILKPDLVEEILPAKERIVEIKRDYYRSPDYMKAGYQHMSERYGNSDRSLTTISWDTGEQVFVLSGKISSGNPYELGAAAGAGMDLRKDHTVVYSYDGKGTITEILPDDNTRQVHTGDEGKPEVLLHFITQDLGEHVESAVYRDRID